MINIDDICEMVTIATIAKESGFNTVAVDPQSVVDMAAAVTNLNAALVEAHRVILHEMDNGRTPYMLKAENGGKGLGYFEDVLGGVKRPS